MPDFEKLKDIFSPNRGIYVIPDYQRGYSWRKEYEIKAFWNDLILINSENDERRFHYTGQFIFEEDENLKLAKDEHIETAKLVVDGQQRLTTCFILFFLLLKEINADNTLGTKLFGQGYENGKVGHTILFASSPKFDEPRIRFMDTDIDSFFKKCLNYYSIDYKTKDEEIQNKPHSNNLYQKNLIMAFDFFKKKVEEVKQKKEIMKLAETLGKKLQFNLTSFLKEQAKDRFNIQVIFETMNDRGKSLTNLEKLKNRLIYLTILLPNNINKKGELRDEINKSWKIIYEQLGKDEKESIEEDSFLRDHWLMYNGEYNKSIAEAYKKSIFDEKFTRDKITEDPEKLAIKIADYTKNLSVSIEYYFYLYFPDQVEDNEVSESLDIIRDLAPASTNNPLLLASLYHYYHDKQGINKQSLLEFLREIERYIFTMFYISNRKSNLKGTRLVNSAKEIFDNPEKLNTLIKELKDLVAKDGQNNYFSPENFKTLISDYFIISDGKGFQDWSKGTKFLLYSYYKFNEELQNKYSGSYREFDYQQGTLIPKNKDSRLQYSLGNFFWANDQFKKNDLTATEIKERGLKILNFLETHWQVKLGSSKFKEEILNIKE